GPWPRPTRCTCNPRPLQTRADGHWRAARNIPNARPKPPRAQHRLSTIREKQRRENARRLSALFFFRNVMTAAAARVQSRCVDDKQRSLNRVAQLDELTGQATSAV